MRLRLDDFGQVRVAGVDLLKAIGTSKTTVPWGFPADMVISWYDGVSMALGFHGK